MSTKPTPTKNSISKNEKQQESTINKILKTYTPSELKIIANGGRLMPGYAPVPVVDFNGKHFKIGGLTDTHIGSKFFQKERLFQAFDTFKKEKVDFIAHAGDVTEGMSNRPGQIYELDQFGYEQQKVEAIKLFNEWKDTKIYMIAGNHDDWFIKNSGGYIVKDICEQLDNAEFLGHSEGDISLNGKVTLKLWHGLDSSSYAVSYRIQKVIESLSGGEKPNVMFFGHTHKSTYLFERNVHCYSLGCLESQSSWMRGKRIAAHVGFWIIDLWVNDNGVSKSGGTFYPFYN